MVFHTINGKSRRGFTLIELLVVMTIVGLLLSIVAPGYVKQTDRARETVLRHNLQTLRVAIDDYRADHGTAPPSLDVLVTQRYLREVPVDPITGKRDTWRSDAADGGGVGDIHSGAPGAGTDGSKYAQW